MPQIAEQLVGLAQILRDNKLTVPPYQRSYSWEQSNVFALLEDIGDAIAEGQEQYFLGSVVLSAGHTAGEAQIVDGQQRLATVAIVLAAIRDVFRANGKTAQADSIQQRFLSSTDIATGREAAHLSLNTYDNDYFLQSVVLSSPDASLPPARNSNARIRDAYEAARAHIAELLGPNGGAGTDRRLASFISFLEHNALVIEVTVPSQANAFTIFEALNERGVALAVSDLIKNHVFAASGDRLSEVQARWDQMLALLESVGDEDVVIQFLRQYWASKHGLVRLKELFEKIKRSIDSDDAAFALAEDLRQSAAIYAAILNSNNQFWTQQEEASAHYNAALKVLRAEQIRPLLLAVLRCFNKGNVLKSFRALLSAAVRIVVAGTRSGSIEKTYAELAQKVSSGEIRGASDLVLELRRITPSDAEFRDAMTSLRISKGYLARYLLREFEIYRVAGAGEWEPAVNTDAVNLEHVMPKSRSAAWAHVSEDDHAASVTRLGNLALLGAGDNSVAADEDFETKSEAYAASSFQTTVEISKCSSWSPEEIYERQIRFATDAPKVWPVAVSRTKTAVARPTKKVGKKKAVSAASAREPGVKPSGSSASGSKPKKKATRRPRRKRGE